MDAPQNQVIGTAVSHSVRIFQAGFFWAQVFLAFTVWRCDCTVQRIILVSHIPHQINGRGVFCGVGGGGVGARELGLDGL